MNNKNQGQEEEDSSNQIGNERTGLSKNLKLAIIGFIVVLGFLGLYIVFKDDSNSEVNARRDKSVNERVNFSEDDNIEFDRKLRSIPEISVPNATNSFNIGDIKAPIAPQLEIPQITVKIPEKPKIDTQVTTLPSIFGAPSSVNAVKDFNTPNFQMTQNDSGGASSRKRNAPVLMIGGAGDTTGDTPAEREKNRLMDLISGRTYKTYTAPSAFAKVTDSYVGLKDRMILAGKMIEIVLETRINTSQEGMMRAMVSSDVYSESGYNILIPAGSRVIGAYKASKKKNLYTVEILLNRVVRPDGIDILLGGMPVTDKLGSMGARPDRVFTGLGKTVMNSVIIGALSIGALAGVKAVERAFPPKTPLLDPVTGRPIEFDDGTSSLATGIVRNVTENLKARVDNGDNTNEPIFVVNQGRALSIMTDKDIVFTDENAFVFYPGEIEALKKENCSRN